VSAFLPVESVRSGEYSSLLCTQKMSVEFAKDGSAEFGIPDRYDSTALDGDLRRICALLKSELDISSRDKSRPGLYFFVGLFPDDDQKGEFLISFAALRDAANAGDAIVIDAYPPEAGSFDGDDKKWFATSDVSTLASSPFRAWVPVSVGDDVSGVSTETLVEVVARAVDEGRSTLVSLVAENGQYGIEVPLLKVPEKSEESGIVLELRSPPL
jgi:hypothetical protein